jgi:HTH-type transcriptional regulator/antitoxin HigA
MALAKLRKFLYSPLMPIEQADFRTPGQLIEKLLAERDWDQRFLGFWLDVSETIVSRMIGGTRAVDAEMALKLSNVFDVPAERFLSLQQAYDLSKAKLVSVPDPDLAAKAALFGSLPLSDMIKRGWIKADSVKDVKAVEPELKRFFSAHDLSEVELLPHAAKKTVVVGASSEKRTSEAQMVWLYQAKRMAEHLLMTSRYSELSARRAINELKPLMLSAESTRKVPRILANAGIRFVIVETIGPAKIDGACLWLDEDSPVIAMTLRHDRIDNFWFTLRHEIEHVFRMHGRDDQEQITLDFELEGAKAGVGQNVPEEEKIANTAAKNFGFTEDYLSKFIAKKSPFFREADVLGFANTVKAHPGIVVGRLQHATERYDLLRKHLVSVKRDVVAEAMVDGWGEVAPVN